MHAENILALLNATRCERCGRAAVPGVTMCLACALERFDAIAEEVSDGLVGEVPKSQVAP